MIPGNAGLDSTFNHHGKGFLVGFMADTGFQQLLDGWLDATWTMLVIFEESYAEKVFIGTGSWPQTSRCLLNWLFANVGSVGSQ